MLPPWRVVELGRTDEARLDVVVGQPVFEGVDPGIDLRRARRPAEQRDVIVGNSLSFAFLTGGEAVGDVAGARPVLERLDPVVDAFLIGRTSEQVLIHAADPARRRTAMVGDIFLRADELRLQLFGRLAVLHGADPVLQSLGVGAAAEVMLIVGLHDIGVVLGAVRQRDGQLLRSDRQQAAVFEAFRAAAQTMAAADGGRGTRRQFACKTCGHESSLPVAPTQSNSESGSVARPNLAKAAGKVQTKDQLKKGSRPNACSRKPAGKSQLNRMTIACQIKLKEYVRFTCDVRSG